VRWRVMERVVRALELTTSSDFMTRASCPNQPFPASSQDCDAVTIK
jgi:hypothetical protein